MENKKKLISVMVPTYNEEENVIPLTDAIVAEFENSLAGSMFFIPRTTADTF